MTSQCRTEDPAEVAADEARVALLLRRGDNLFDAVTNGDLPAVRGWVRRDSTAVEARGDDAWTALHYAAYNGRTAMVEFLLAYNADIDAESVRGARGGSEWSERRAGFAAAEVRRRCISQPTAATSTASNSS